jgi:acetoin utilization protein AcuB
MQPTIETFMTKQIHTIRSDASLSEAHRMMRQHHVRHLPVLEAGRLVGIISDRDLYLVEALGMEMHDDMTVEDAMSQDVLVAQQSDLIGDVARLMAERKAGSAVIVRHDHVIGIFTTIDALRALSAYCEMKDQGSPERKTAPIGSRLIMGR